MIEVKNLVKKYGGYLAVDNLSFTIEKGKIYGFLGPNGAGKSTTMNIMTGYLGATDGEVLINGYNILKDPEAAKKSIGYLPELPPLYTDMTVLEYLQFVAELKKVKKSEREESVEKVIRLVKLEEVRNRLIRNLSKGYKQRVGLAQAVLGFPEIIILDEPTVGLDPKQIIEIRELIRTLAKDHTIILSSHILAEVREVCDYIMIISKGKLVASDTPDHLETVMAGSDDIEILAKGTAAQVKAILETVPYIHNRSLEDKEDHTIYGRLEVSAGYDIREQLFYAFADAKCPLLMLKNNKVTLEEVFLELTQNEKAVPVMNDQPETVEEKEVNPDESDL